MADAQQPVAQGASTKRKWVSAFVAFVLGGGLFTALTKWDEAEGVQRRLCVSWDLTRDLAQGTDQCLRKFWVVQPAKATQVIDSFIVAAAGQPSKAVPLLGPAYQPAPAREDFVNTWEDVAWAERIGDVRVSSEVFNEFTATVRLYRVPRLKGRPDQYNYWGPRQTVDVREYTFRLEEQDTTDTLVTKLTSGNKLAGRTRTMALAVFTVDTYGRRRPDAESPPSGATDVRKGSSLRVLCSTADRQWLSTYIGWFPEDELTLTQEPDEGVLVCGSLPE